MDCNLPVDDLAVEAPDRGAWSRSLKNINWDTKAPYGALFCNSSSTNRVQNYLQQPRFVMAIKYNIKAV